MAPIKDLDSCQPTTHHHKSTLKGLWGLTLILLTWRIWWASNNASRRQMGFNSVFKGL